MNHGKYCSLPTAVRSLMATAAITLRSATYSRGTWYLPTQLQGRVGAGMDYESLQYEYAHRGRPLVLDKKAGEKRKETPGVSGPLQGRDQQRFWKGTITGKEPTALA